MGFSYHKNFPCYVLQLFFLILSCLYMFSAAIDIIRADEYLSDSEALISDGNKFKLSFFSPPNSTLRYLGIMYNLPVMTVVWVANRNKPLNDSSGTFQVSSDGNLVVLDGRKEIVWSTNLSPSVVNRSVVLLNTGNLVLRDDSNDNAYVWESFQHASDSWLEKMKILTDLSRNEKSILTSWTSPDDPAPGSFTMTIEPLDIPQSFIWKDGNPYYRTGPWNGQIFTGIPFMRSDYHYGTDVVTEIPGTAYEMFTVPNSSIILYYILNSSGSLEEKVWSDEKKGWDVTWSTTIDECYMYGKCGPFGSCDAQNRPICSCFRGFMPRSKDEWEAGNWTSGCTRKTHLQCEQNSSVGKQDEFLKTEGVKLPDHFTLFPFSKRECRDACLSDCSCIAYAVPPGIGCLHWTHNLTDTHKLNDGGDDLYIRLAQSELDQTKDHRRTIVISVVLGFILVCAYFLLKYKAGKHILRLLFFRTTESDTGYSEERVLKHDKHGVKLEELPAFTFMVLSNATENFDRTNKLGGWLWFCLQRKISKWYRNCCKKASKIIKPRGGGVHE